MAESLERLRTLRRAGQGATASPTSSCSAWAARASRRKCCARCSALRRAGRAFTCSTRPIRQRSAPSATPPERTLYHPRQQVGHDDRAELARRAFSAAARATPASPRWADHFVAITDEGTELDARARARAVPRRLHQPVRHRRPLLGAVVLRPGAGGADGPGPRGDRRLGRWRCSSAARAGARRRDGEPGGRRSAWRWRRRARRPRQADADRCRRRSSRSACGSSSWSPRAPARTASASSRSPASRSAGPTSTATDRLFVRLQRRRTTASAEDAAMRELKTSARRSSRSTLPEPSALGAEFVRWEIATAVAGALLGINPFDEPNVQQAKDATRVLLDSYKTTDAAGRRARSRRRPTGVALTLSAAARDGACSAGSRRRAPDADRRRATTSRCSPISGRTPRSAASCSALRARGARSHAGGDDVRLRTALSALDRAAAQGRTEHRRVRAHHGRRRSRICRFPGEPFSFGTLELAQALGDFASLDAAGRRALHVHLPAPDPRCCAAAETLLARLPVA